MDRLAPYHHLQINGNSTEESKECPDIEASIAIVPNGSPGPTELYPRCTHRRTADPEVGSDPDIWDTGTAKLGEEKPERARPDMSEEDSWSRTETEWRTAPGAKGRTESREKNDREDANDRSRNPETGGSLEKGPKTPWRH
ncbi:hypothetical protein NDU88_005289 [Pleurodeles waltl]|uniref:Uncharacterized protein n=1 Tax=Pleurodeles waltl TaxID=8319 RepID=A0AAV7WUB8_PLEWA|nr:hypothetical protein NDU88_005289 [Pleurodeles waltl]